MNKCDKKVNRKSVIKKDGPVIFVEFPKKDEFFQFENPTDIDSLQRDIENMELMSDPKDSA